MRRILMLVTVVAIMAAMVAAMALPAVAAKPAPTKDECRQTNFALVRGEDLTPQQEQLFKQFASLGRCMQASPG
jgi:hypothetical protein